ncbi:Rv1535 domain-containing protein [Mycobacterium sp.]|uniref:Rv1535 domain-containing protein n=1 Tax=Mycobacterium sp. TaxID=1785 RepID=UPI002CAA7EF6|nr:Rv1535 domain-containing protein [Mycobacterium sp.]HME49807.1 Rv1535 domain-containing protein [Mycobacterium sp.]
MSREGVYGSDPLTDAVSRVLVLPLRELYALLWRAGVVHIVEGPAASSDEALVRSRGTTAAAAVATAAVPSA